MTGIIYQYKVNNKYYVGKTYGLERKRMDKHKYEAYTLKANHPFHRAIRKYGWEFVKAGYSVIERIEADDKQTLNEKLIEREAFWIKERNSLVPNGYNVLKSGQVTIPHTQNKEEVYKKISNSLKGKYLNNPTTSKRVYCIEQDKWYPSQSEAERVNHLTKGSVEKSASGKNVTAGGLSWNYNGAKTHRANQIVASRKKIVCVETGEVFESIYGLAKILWGKNATKNKCRIQASLRDGWAVSGRHYKYVEQDNPVLSETEV